VLPAHALEAVAVVVGADALQVSAAVAVSEPAVAVAAFVKMAVLPRPEVAASKPAAFVRMAVLPLVASAVAVAAVEPSIAAVAAAADMPIAAAVTAAATIGAAADSFRVQSLAP
jgi:hypothetical protein